MLACGAIANIPPPIVDKEAILYEQLAQTALGITSIFDNTTLEAIQAVALLGGYQMFAFISRGFEQIWKTVNFATVLGLDVSILPSVTLRYLMLLPVLVASK